MAMLSALQHPTPLVLQVQATPAQVSAFLAGGSYFDDVTYDAGTDYSMIWCIGLMVGVPPSTEVAALRAALPQRSSVQFFHPKHHENPTVVTKISDNGLEETLSGAWCCTFRTPTLSKMRTVLGIFFWEYMGIQNLVRGKGFEHRKAWHQFLIRRNMTPFDKKWDARFDSRFTIDLQYNGVLTMAAGTFVRKLLKQYKFLCWSGEFSADVSGLFSSHLPCACESADDVKDKWVCFQRMRSKNITSGPDWTSFAELKVQLLGHAAESAQRAVAVASELECLLGGGETAFQFTQEMLSKLLGDQQKHSFSGLVNTPASSLPTVVVQRDNAQPSLLQSPLSLLSPHSSTAVSQDLDEPVSYTHLTLPTNREV